MMTHDPLCPSAEGQGRDEDIKAAIIAALDRLPTFLYLSAVAVDRQYEFVVGGQQVHHLTADIDMVGHEKTVRLLVSAIRDYYTYYEDRKATFAEEVNSLRPEPLRGSIVEDDEGRQGAWEKGYRAGFFAAVDSLKELQGEPSWDFKMRSKLLGPHLEHHPNDPEQSRIWRNGEWVKP